MERTQDAAQPLLLLSNWCHVQWTCEPKVGGVLQAFFLVCLRRSTTPVSKKDIMQCTFHELHCPLATIMCQTVSCFLVAKFNIHCGISNAKKASRFSRIARIIRLGQYMPNPSIKMGSLTSDISIANMPHTRANQILIPFIPFRMGIRLTAISEPVLGIWKLIPCRGRS